MRNNKGMTDELRLSYLEEYFSSSLNSYHFEKEKGLTHHSIQRWLCIFGFEDKPSPIMNNHQNQTEKELQEKIEALEKELKSLKVELKQSNMARDAYNCMIDLAEETYNIKVRKNSDAK